MHHFCTSKEFTIISVSNLRLRFYNPSNYVKKSGRLVSLCHDLATSATAETNDTWAIIKDSIDSLTMVLVESEVYHTPT